MSYGPNLKIKDRPVLITGGTGSLGTALARELLDHHQPHAVIIYSRDELKQAQMQRRFNDPRLHFVLGDVRDRDRLERVTRRVDVIFHAAALKQVHSCEANPSEAINTNILGTMNVIQVAIDRGISHTLIISTDKAAKPVNLYGATKLCAEKLVVHANQTHGDKVKFACIRLGNFIGSRGSVVPLFFEQKEANRLTVTDRRMTRFAVTHTQAAKLSLKAVGLARGGEVFVPPLPSLRIEDLASAIAPDAELVEIGARPGEKMHETLISLEEAPQTVSLRDFYAVLPAKPYRSRHIPPYPGEPVGETFRLSSDNNELWLNREEVAELLSNLNQDTYHME